MRLIDADKFNGKVIASHTGSGVIKLVAIDDVPTAYDPEKVVEQLEKLKKAEELRADDCDEDGYGDSEQIYDDGKSQGRYEAFGKAIKIVKDGGTDEEKRHIRTEKKNDKE